jgi:hypothetical protein
MDVTYISKGSYKKQGCDLVTDLSVSVYKTVEIDLYD